jgi:hypothetical protein
VLHIVSAIHGSFDLIVPVSVDDADTCLKQSSGRGFGTIPSDGNCPDSQEESGALCYPICPDGFHGAGPVCWQNCPSGMPNKCGVMCTASDFECVERTASIVKTAMETAVSIATIEDPADILVLIKQAFDIADTVQDVMSNPYC